MSQGQGTISSNDLIYWSDFNSGYVSNNTDIICFTNKQSIIVRINDRGPFVRGRIIDLSKHAAKMIGMNGTQMVSLELQ